MNSLNLPNLLTMMRILLVPVFTYFFLKGDYLLALLVYVFTGMTDFIDGLLARCLHKKTALGAILDPAADKFLMFVTFIVLALRGFVPVFLSALVIFRDAWIIGGLAVLKGKHKELYFKTTLLSKWNTFFQLLTILLAFCLALSLSGEYAELSRYQDLFKQLLHASIYTTAFSTIVTGIQYTKIGFELYRRG